MLHSAPGLDVFLRARPHGYSLDEAGTGWPEGTKPVSPFCFAVVIARGRQGILKLAGTSSKPKGCGDTSWMLAGVKAIHREFQLEKTDINTCRMILSRTGLCTGVLVTIGSCGWWWCAIPAGNLLWMSDVLFICVCSQVLRCVASARSSSQWPCCEGRFLSPFYSWKIEAQRALIAFEELSAVWQSCFLTA